MTTAPCTAKQKTNEKADIAASLMRPNGAEGGTRTLTGFLPLPPQDSVSTNSTTSARGYQLVGLGCFLRRSAGLLLGLHFFKLDVKNGGLFHLVVAREYVVAQLGDDKEQRHERSELGKNAARARAAEDGSVAATEDYSHAFLAGLQQDQHHEGEAGNHMKDQNERLHRILLLTRRTARQALMMRLKLSACKEAPPTKTPSTLSRPMISEALSGFTLPP